MRCPSSTALLLGALLFTADPTARAEDATPAPAEAAQAEAASPFAALHWQTGPGEAPIGNVATIKLPADYVFLDAAETKKFMDLTQNLGNGREYLFAPSDLSWFSIFEYSEEGYVKDDEKLDADAVLESVREGTEAGNAEKRQRGWDTLSIVGWHFPPQYDQKSKMLEWALLARSDSDKSEVINYNTRLLGRSGVMQVVLVADPKLLDGAVSALKHSIDGYAFNPGQTYAEFQPGDRVAEYGLAALIAGGAAAVATKKGLWGVIAVFLVKAWKLVALAVVGIGVGIKSLFSRKKSEH